MKLDRHIETLAKMMQAELDKTNPKDALYLDNLEPSRKHDWRKDTVDDLYVSMQITAEELLKLINEHAYYDSVLKCAELGNYVAMLQDNLGSTVSTLQGMLFSEEPASAHKEAAPPDMDYCRNCGVFFNKEVAKEFTKQKFSKEGNWIGARYLPEVNLIEYTYSCAGEDTVICPNCRQVFSGEEPKQLITHIKLENEK